MATTPGERFSHLVAIGPTDKRDAKGSIKWRFQCDCGGFVERVPCSVRDHMANGKRAFCGHTCPLRAEDRARTLRTLRDRARRNREFFQ